MSNFNPDQQDSPASISTTLRQIKLLLDQPLPGIPAQLKMAPPDRTRGRYPSSPGPKAVKAGILILLYPFQERLVTVVIRRNTYPGPHSGQISFPGGKYEVSDNTLVNTALREAGEEIGIHPDHIQLLGALTPLFIPVSQIEVYPFAGYSTVLPELHADPSEVEEIIHVDLTTLISDPPGEMILHRKNEIIAVPCYQVQNHQIWGATAMILSEFLEIFRKAGDY